jgi:hypothetical protein
VARNRKSHPEKIKKTVAKMKKNDPHLEINDQDMPDPFAFAAKKVVNAIDEVKKTINKKMPQSKIVDKLLNKDMAKTVKKSLNNYMDSTSNGISNTSEVTKASTVFFERVINSLTTTVSAALEENTNLSQDLLKCKDVKDYMGFQQKMFEANFSNMVNFCLDISFAVQAYTSKNIQLSSQFNDKNIKSFTGEII